MRALAAVAALFTLACPCLHARAHLPEYSIPRALYNTLGLNKESPAHNIFTCSQNLGLTKCVSAFSAWRAENALENMENGFETRSNLASDVKEFSWKQYSNATEDQLNSQLCDGTERLLRYRQLSLSMLPGYKFFLESKGNGILNVDVLKNDDKDNKESGRASSKKLQKRFYNILPLLLLPGLIMSAILPFVLPALKLSVVAVGMLNNMALSGAIFTLLRNNAFNDHYEKKVLYVNDGYKNEHAHYHYKEIPLENVEVQYSPSDAHTIVDESTAEDGVIVEEYPTNAQWIAQYYGDVQAVKNRRSSQRKKYSSLMPH